MELSGSRILPATPDEVWAALNDPDVLRECIPGCESLTRESESLWRSVVATKIGPVSARFNGTVELVDVVAPTSYTLRFKGQGGAAGFANGEADVRLSPAGAGETQLDYAARAQIGGKLAQIGSRLVDGVAASLAEQFFTRFTARFATPSVPAGDSTPEASRILQRSPQSQASMHHTAASGASSRRLALKIDADTYRGTREGVPALAALLQRHGAGATFLFSLGPDHTGRAIRRAMRPGFMKKVGRTSVMSHYGVKTLLYGTLLPGPDIGKRCADEMRRVRDMGFEVGVHTWDHVTWQDGVAAGDAQWTTWQMGRAAQRFRDVFGEEPKVHGAAGWQMNVHAFRRTQSLGFHYASDTRGSHPFIPVVRAEIMACPQIPTTLPTMDELIGLDGVSEQNVAERLLALLAAEPHDHVFTLHAELEGAKLAPAFERFLEGARELGYAPCAMRDLAESIDLALLPLHSIVEAGVPGRSGTLAMQGPAFLA
jgi:undecaprenyl phosphate-alpha-L-ara4FN deformylase